MRKTILLILLLTTSAFGQTIGDYRSANSGNWEALVTWEYYDGNAWVIPSGKAPQGYPGEFEGTNNVHIQSSKTIDISSAGITTKPFNQLLIDGALILNGSNTNPSFFINTNEIIVTKNLQLKPYIEFINQVSLRLPQNSSLQVGAGGLAGNCSTGQALFIGLVKYAVCTGSGTNNSDTGLSFIDLMNAGGSLTAIPETNSPVSVGATIFLNGEYMGAPGDNLSFQWAITDPLNNVNSFNVQNFVIPNAIKGIYTVKFSCFTIYNDGSFRETDYSHSKTLEVIVNAGQSPDAPTAISGTGATCNEITANWEASPDATKYYLDVATDLNFTNFVTGYENLDVGNVLSKKATGLANGTTYYYRVYAYKDNVLSTRSNTISYATLTTPNGLSATVTAQPTCTVPTGTVTLNSSYLGDSRYEYNTDGGQYQSSNVFTDLKSGNHVFTVRIVGQESCVSDPAAASINESLQIPIADAGADFTKTCNSNPSGKQIGAAPVNGVTYSWTPTLGLSDATVANPIANPTTTTTYTLTATQTVGGCTATDTAVVTVTISPPNATAGNDFTKSCSSFTNGNKIGSASESGISYSWTPSTGLSDSTISDPIANPDITTTYTLLAVNTATGCSVTDTVLVTVNTVNPIANAGIDFTKTCTINQNGKTIGVEPLPDTQYAWSPATGLSAANIANPIANPSVSTVYTLETTNMANGCKATDTVLVTVDITGPIANAGVSFTKTCIQFPSGKEIGSQPEPGTTYSWSPSTGLSSTIISNPIANPTVTTSYTVTATNSNTGCIASDSVTVSVYSTIPIADAGTDFTKSCIANSSGKNIGADALAGTVYGWSPSTGLSNANISNPIANPTETTVYTLTTINLESSCTATDQVIVTVDITAPEANAGADFTKSCTLNPSGASIGAAQMAGLIYNWSPSTGLSDPTVSNPIANPNVSTAYTLTTTSIANGCINSDTVLVTVDTANPIADAGADFTKTCTSNPSGKIIGASPVAGNTYSWSPTTGLSNATVSNPLANPTVTTTYNLTVTGINGCSATDEIVVTVNNISPSSGAAGTNKTITCSVPTVSIGSIAEAETTYSWSPTTGLSNASISNPTASPAVTTTYTLTATNTASGCESTDSVTVTVNNTLPAAPIPVIGYQPNCNIPSGKIILNGLPSGNWTVIVYRNNIRFSTIPGSGSSVSISQFSPATYYFTVTVNESGCISPASVDVVINPPPDTPSTPEIGIITHPTCATGGSVVLTNLPTAGTWTLHQSGTSNSQITGSGSSTTVSGLLPGAYQFKVVSDVGCVSPISNDVVMNDISSEATLGTVVHPTCAVSTGSITFNNLPTTGWTITQTGPINVTITEPSPSPSTYTATALTAGVYNFVLDSGAICLAQDGNVTINTQPPTPLVPTVNITSNPSCSDSDTSISISNLPSGNWSLEVFDSSSVIVQTITGTGANYSVTGTFIPGNYNVAVTNEQGCISASSAPFTIIAQPLPLATPTIGTITQPVCGTPKGSVVINGLPASGTWILNQSGTANASYSGSGTFFTVPSLVEGSYHFTVSGISGTCSSEASATVVIDKAKIVPAAPTIVQVTQPTCNSSTGSIELNGLPSGSWTIYATPAIGDGTGLIGSGTTAILTGVLVGSYIIAVKNADGCLSSSSLPFTLNPQPVSPATPLLSIPIQPTCTVATGSFTITNYDSSNIYVVNPNSGVTVSGDTVIAPRGNYTVTAILADCSSNASAVAVIDKQPETPSAPVIVSVMQPTCESNSSSIELSGLPVGSWTLFASPEIENGTGLNGSGTTAILTGTLIGTYTLTVRNSDGCVSSSSLPFTLNEQPITPEVPILSLPIQPSCTVATGSFTIANYNSNYTYTINPNNGVILSGNNVMAPKGNYTVTATFGNCTSGKSAVVEILQQPLTPTAPIIGNIVHPNCGSNKGSVEVSGLPAGAWTLYAFPEIVAGNPGIQGVGPTAFFNSMPAGSYTLTVKNSEGCISEKSILFAINFQPVTPSKPELSSVTQPTCTVSTGNFSITNYDANSSYTVVPNTGVVISGNLITAPAGNYTVFATLGYCSSVSSEMIIVNPQPILPSAPIIDFVNQATCESISGSIGLSGLPEESWTLTSSGGTTLTGMGTTAILSGNTVPGTYTVTVTNVDGCTSLPSAQVILNAQPSVPNAPTVGSITQPDCIIETGMVVISIPAEGTGFEYNIDGGEYQASATFSNIPSGTHQLSCRSITVGSCISDPTIVEIRKPLFVNPPIVKSIIQPTCNIKGSILLEGLPAGSWTLYQSGTSTETILGSGTTATISNLEIGTYSYRVFDGSCLSVKLSDIDHCFPI